MRNTTSVLSAVKRIDKTAIVKFLDKAVAQKCRRLAAPGGPKKHRAHEYHDNRFHFYGRGCAGPFGQKSALHSSELSQTPAAKTIKSQDPAMKRLFNRQLNRRLEQSLKHGAQ